MSVGLSPRVRLAARLSDVPEAAFGRSVAEKGELHA